MLTNIEIEKPRTPTILYHWCRNRIEELAATGGTNDLRMRRGLCKELLEEVYPIAIWAFHSAHISGDAQITPKLGSQPFDGIVVDGNAKPSEYYLEVTQAHMGQSEHFRMLHLEKKGWAPGPLSELKRVGPKRGGRIEPGRTMTSMEDHLQKSEDLVVEAIRRKLGKTYPESTRLLVTFEDFIIKDEPNVTERLRTAIRKLLAGKDCTFETIYLVGMSEKLLIDYAC